MVNIIAISKRFIFALTVRFSFSGHPSVDDGCTERSERSVYDNPVDSCYCQSYEAIACTNIPLPQRCQAAGNSWQSICVLAEIIGRLGWRHISIYTDSASESMVADIIAHIQLMEVPGLVTSQRGERNFAQLREQGFFDKTKVDIDLLNVVLCKAGCVQKIQGLVRKNASPVFLRRSRWVLVTNQVGPELMVSGMDNILIVVQNPSSTNRSIISTMNINGDSRHFKTIEEMEYRRGICNTDKEVGRRMLFPNTRGLNGRTLRVGVGEWGRYLRRIWSNQSEVKYSGLSVDLLRYLQDALNFRVTFVEPTGELDVWSNLFQMLEKQESSSHALVVRTVAVATARLLDSKGTRKILVCFANAEIDFVPTPVSRSQQRQTQMDFTYPMMFGSVGVFYKQPPAEEGRFRILLDVLSWRVVVFFIVALLTTSLLQVVCFVRDFVATSRATGIYSWNTMLSTFRRNTFRLLATFLRQGLDDHQSQCPTSASMLFAVWSIFCLIFTAIFTAQLVSHLGVAKPKRPFQTLRDVIENNEYKLGVEGGVNWVHSFLQNVTKKDHRELYHKIETFYETDKDVKHLESGVHWKRVNSEKYAFVSSYNRMTSEVYNNSCGIVQLDQRVVTTYASLVLAKNSPYTDIFDAKILDFHEYGLIDLLHKKWMTPRRQCALRNRVSPSDVDMEMVQSIFCLSAICIAVSFLVLVFEIIIGYRRSSLT